MHNTTLQAFRALRNSAAVSKILEKSAPQRAFSQTVQGGVHVDARRKAYSESDVIEVNQGNDMMWVARNNGRARGAGETPIQAVAYADLNMINERAISEGKRAPYRGQEFAWVVAGIDEDGEIEVVILPLHVADSQERALDIADVPNGCAHVFMLHLVKASPGDFKAFTTVEQAANYLMEKMGNPF